MTEPGLCALCRKQKSTCWSEHYGIKLPFCSIKCSNLLCAALSYGTDDDSFHQGALIGVKPGEQAPAPDQLEELIKRLQNLQIGWEGQRVRDAATMGAPPGQESPMAWKTLPFDIRLMILTGVPLLEAIRLSGVNRKWQQTLSNDHTWHAFYQRSIVGAIGGTDKLVLPTWREQTIAYLKMFDFVVFNKSEGRIERFVPIRSGPERRFLVLQRSGDTIRIVFGVHLRMMICNRPVDSIVIHSTETRGFSRYQRDAQDPDLFKESGGLQSGPVGPRALALQRSGDATQVRYYGNGEYDVITLDGVTVQLVVLGWESPGELPSKVEFTESWGSLSQYPYRDGQFVFAASQASQAAPGRFVLQPYPVPGPTQTLLSISLSLEIVGPSKEDYGRREITTITHENEYLSETVRQIGRVTSPDDRGSDLPWVRHLRSIEDSLEKAPVVAIGRIESEHGGPVDLSISVKVRIGVPIFLSKTPERIVAAFCATFLGTPEAKFVRHDFDLPDDKDVNVMLLQTFRFVPLEGTVDREWIMGVANRTIGIRHNADAEIEYRIYTPVGKKMLANIFPVPWYLGRALRRSPPVFLPIYPTSNLWPGIFDTVKGGPDGIATKIAEQ